MSKARELYGSELDHSWFCVSSYQPIIDSFGKVLIQDEDQDYSGDTRVIYYENGKYGFLNFGWGSCSGCDALQACRSEEDVNKLIEELRRDVKWFDTLKELKDYLTSKDRAASYYSHEEDWSGFVTKTLTLKEVE